MEDCQNKVTNLAHTWVTEVANNIINQMPGEGRSLAFREFVWGFVNQIAKGLVLLGKTPSHPELKRYAQDVEPLFIDVMTNIFEKYYPNYKDDLNKYQNALKMKAEDRRNAGFDFSIPRSMQDRSSLGKSCYLVYQEKHETFMQSDTEKDVCFSLMKAFNTDSSYMGKLVASLKNGVLSNGTI